MADPGHTVLVVMGVIGTIYALVAIVLIGVAIWLDDKRGHRG